MTNVGSIAGSFAWTAVAALLMLVTFEPVNVQRPAELVQFGAEAEAGPADAAL